MDTAKKKNSSVAIRVEIIARLMLQGMQRRSIHDWVQRSAWGISERTVDRLIRRASLLLAKEADRNTNIKTEFQLAKGRLEMLFRAALDTSNGQKPNIRAALACQKELNRLLGLATDGHDSRAVDEPISFDIIGVKDPVEAPAVVE